MSLTTVSQTIRSAAGAPPIQTTGASSVFTLAKPHDVHSEEGASTDAPPSVKPRVVLLSAIVRRSGVWKRDELRAACSTLNGKQFQNAITVSTVGGFIRKVGDSFEITDKGREALRREVDAAGAAVKFKKPRKSQTAATPLASAPLKIGAELSPGFRCAIFSDGAFVIEKDNSRIELTNTEFQVMHAYTQHI